MIPAIGLNRLLFWAVSAVGFFAVLGSLTLDWFGVPVAPVGGIDSWEQIETASPGCVPVFKIAMLISFVCLMASWFWQRNWNPISASIAGMMILVSLMFPYFVTVRSPQVAADAAWLQMQHNNLTWLGGDIYLNAEHGSRGWRSKVYLVDIPRQLSVVRLPSWSPWEFGLHRTEDLLLWLGYSQAFCQFVGRGWTLAVVGSFFLFLGTIQQRGRVDFFRVTTAVALFFVVAVFVAIVGWSRPFVASQYIRQAADLASSQNYAGAKQQLELAARMLPVLGQDTFYIAQRGILDQRLAIASEYAALRRGKDLQGSGRAEQANAIFCKLADSDNPAIGREANRAILGLAIQDYNCARFERSSDRFWFVLRRNPCDVKLIYLLQLQAIRESRVQRANALRDWMYAATDRYNFGTKKVIRAAAQQQAATAVGMTSDAAAIWASQSRAKRP